MDLFEYQGKELFAAAGIPVVRARMVHPDGPEPGEAAAELGLPVVVKAQALTGGRGKAGGVRVTETVEQVRTAAVEIMAMTIRGKPVVGVLLEQAVDRERELYLALAVDRAARRPLLLFSTRGGVDIEAVARDDPQAVLRRHVDPLAGLTVEQATEVAAWAGLPDAPAGRLVALLDALWQLFRASDATLVEINPLGVVAGRLVALDAKVTLDDNAAFRHPEWAAYRSAADERERAAAAAGIHYVPLDGDVGVLGNGAGMVMSTLDLIAEAGGAPADFLDVGGGAREARIAAALDLILAQPGVRALCVTIFGGITRCDEVARALVDVLSAKGAAVAGLPVLVRLDGNGAAAGRQIVDAAALPGVRAAASVWQAVRQAVAAAAARGAEGV
jgi:succinyl-CoA synthetase beta subunit